ncbi:MAG: hypothetical protein ACMUEL_02810 [Flavobacteriales bacterium Tduv]
MLNKELDPLISTQSSGIFFSRFYLDNFANVNGIGMDFFIDSVSQHVSRFELYVEQEFDAFFAR